MGNRLHRGVEPLVDRYDWLAEARGRGLMLAVKTVVPGGIEPDAARATALLEAAKSEGLLIGKGGLYGNVLRMAPPLSITETEVDEGLAMLTAAIEKID